MFPCQPRSWIWSWTLGFFTTLATQSVRFSLLTSWSVKWCASLEVGLLQACRKAERCAINVLIWSWKAEEVCTVEKLSSLISILLLYCSNGWHTPVHNFDVKEGSEFWSSFFMPHFVSYSFLEAARYVECFKALVNKPPEELQPEVAIATAQKDQLTLATDFFTSLRVVSRSDAAALLSRFGVRRLFFSIQGSFQYLYTAIKA